MEDEQINNVIRGGWNLIHAFLPKEHFVDVEPIKRKIGVRRPSSHPRRSHHPVPVSALELRQKFTKMMQEDELGTSGLFTMNDIDLSSKQFKPDSSLWPLQGSKIKYAPLSAPSTKSKVPLSHSALQGFESSAAKMLHLSCFASMLVDAQETMLDQESVSPDDVRDAVQAMRCAMTDMMALSSFQLANFSLIRRESAIREQGLEKDKTFSRKAKQSTFTGEHLFGPEASEALDERNRDPATAIYKLKRLFRPQFSASRNYAQGAVRRAKRGGQHSSNFSRSGGQSRGQNWNQRGRRSYKQPAYTPATTTSSSKSNAPTDRQ